VLVKDLPNDRAVPKNATTSTTGPDGAPRYYVAVAPVPQKIPNQYNIVVGDSVTGKTLATFTPPARTMFQGVSAASDDKTFVVSALTSSTGSFGHSKDTVSGSWYKVSLAPGTAHPARLSKLPIKPWSWADGSGGPVPGEIFATALSENGRELAIADVPDIPAAATKAENWHEVKVFSVATGRPLRDWIENNPTTRLVTFAGGGDGAVVGPPPGPLDLTWIDGDRALALATSYSVSNAAGDGVRSVTGTVRRLDLAGPASGNLMKDATVLWSGTLPIDPSGQTAPGGCLDAYDWPPLISADGKTITCVAEDELAHAVDRIRFLTEPFSAGTTPSAKERLDYQVTWPPTKVNGKLENLGGSADVLWLSPSADTLIVDSVAGLLSPLGPPHFGVVSHGKYTPLRLPASLDSPGGMADIAF
jgi:hypothetical protein